MKPVAIFRHAPTEGPGYLATFLDEHRIPWQLIAIDEGDAVPADIHDWSGLVFMGGPMSVNDDLPWIAPVLQRIRDAVAAGIPVLGHCLGGQLMSRALGGEITRNPVKEIGWGEVETTGEAGTQLFGRARFTGFHWHGETFSIPAGAQRVLQSAWCANQAFVLGPHIGFQCHIEMTDDMVKAWCEVGADEIREAAASPGVQPAQTILHDLPERVRALQRVAASVYTQWITGLRAR